MTKLTRFPNPSRKRRDNDSQRPSRGGQPRTPNQISYTDFDQAMEAGVESEEKGERFQIGSKAQRFFEQAYRLYMRASQLKPNSADGLYNAARVQYLLGTDFLLPPRSLATVAGSVLLFKRALSLVLAGTTPSPFALDVISNLATALQSLGEMVQEVGWLDQQAAAQQLASVTDYSVFAMEDDAQRHGPTPSKLLQEAISFYRTAADGQALDLADQAKEEPESEQPPTAEAETSMVGDSPAMDFGYTTSLITVTTHVETLLALQTCLLSLLSTCNTAKKVSICCDNADQALEQAQLALFQPDAISDQAEKRAKTLELQRARLGLQIARTSKLAEMGKFLPSTELEDQVQQWATEELVAKPAEVATLCELGDAGLTLARLRLRSGATDEHAIARAWTLGTTCSRCFNAALSLLDTSNPSAASAAVLGATNTSTPTSRTRANILTSLVSVSLLRTAPIFEACSATFLPGAANSRSKLLENARIYGRKAVTQLGIQWILSAKVSERPEANVHPHAHGGWESLRNESDAVMALGRALWMRNPQDDEVKRTLFAVWSLCRKDEAFRIAYGSSSDGVSMGAERFVEDLTADEGPLSTQELEWWESWTQTVDPVQS